MVERYTREAMGKLWTVEARFQNMLEVEQAVAEAQAEVGLIPEESARQIREKGRFDVARILEIEKETRHDVIAFVSNVAENVGSEGRFVHYGLTSSDVLDTALSIQIQKAGIVLMESVARLLTSLKNIALKHERTLCAGRTHGMHAEPTTFGFKMAGFFYEIQRNQERLDLALSQIAVGKLSGAVGTSSYLSPQIEQMVCERLGLQPETVATQVIPRDRHAEVMVALSLLGAAMERMSVEIRHLQRTEVGEVSEGFSRGQKGSSAMPHKKNPIGAENITGCARLLRGYALAAIENVALWHERDISHSSVERVALPDAFILADYACDRMAKLIGDLEIHAERMKHNMDLSQGQLFSSHLLLHLVDQGLSREEAYKIVQQASHGLKPGEHLKDTLAEAEETKKYFTKDDLSSIFSGERHLKNIHPTFQKLRSEP